MDSTLAAAIVGGFCAIGGSIVSHILVHVFDRKKEADNRRRISLEFALVFLEKCKTGMAGDLSDDDYYALIRNLASLEPHMRKKVITLYQDARAKPLSDNLIYEASALQATIARIIK